MGRRTLVLFIAGFFLLLAGFALGQKSEKGADKSQVPADTSLPTPSVAISVTEVKARKVLKVIDGDTVDIEIDGKKETVRLIGIDTPETVDPREPVQCFGKEASDYARQLLDGKRVRLEKDDTQGSRDKYDRLLRYLFLEDGTHVNKVMIEQGYAHEYTYKLPYKYQTEFREAEKQARENNRGLWSACKEEQQKSVEGTSTDTQSPQVAEDKDCNDFTTQEEAQAFFISQGGPSKDPHRLDKDKDGVACESLP